MSPPRLLYVAPVLRLLSRVQCLPLDERRLFWRSYAALRRSLRVRPFPVSQTAFGMTTAIEQGLPYSVVSQALKLARAYTWQSLGARGEATRAQRALADEYFRLLRMHLRSLLGLRQLPSEPAWNHGDPPGDRAWRAVCDGSHKSARSAVGIVVYSPDNFVCAEVSVAVPADTAVDAELHASILALQTLEALDAKEVLLQVDALCVVRAFEQRLPLRYCLEEAEMAQLARRFKALRVQLVPRLATEVADRLAARVSRH